MRLERLGNLGKGLLAGVVFISVAACSGGASSDGKQPVPDQMRAERQGTPITKPSSAGNYLAGKFAFSQRDTEAAAAYFAKALGEEPDNIDLQRQAYRAFTANGDLDRALPLARALTKAGNPTAAMRLMLAAEDIKEGNFGAAAENISAIEDKGFSILIKPLLLAWSHVGAGETTKGLKALDALDKYDGFKALKDYHSGLLADIGGQGKAADEYYKAAIEGPAGRAVRLVLFYGHYLARNNQSGEAVKLFEDYMVEFPISPTIGAALSALRAGRTDFGDVSDAKQGFAEALYSAATALARERARGIAVTYIYMALRLKPDFPAAQMLLGEIWEDRRAWAKARAIYEGVDAAAAQHRDAAIRMAWTRHKMGDAAAARAELERLAAEDKSDIEPLVVLADIYRDQKKWKIAAQNYGRALDRLPKFLPHHWALFYARGIAYEQSKQWPKAELDLLQALELRPNHPQVMNYLAYSWVDRDERLEEARGMLERAVSLRPRDGYIIDSLGWLYYRLADFDKAVVQLEKAVSLSASDPTINDHLGDAYWRVGRKAEARYQWQRAIWLEKDKEKIPPIEEKLKSGLKDLAPDDKTPIKKN